MAQCPAGYAPRLFWPSSHFYGFMGNGRNLWRSVYRATQRAPGTFASSWVAAASPLVTNPPPGLLLSLSSLSLSLSVFLARSLVFTPAAQLFFLFSKVVSRKRELLGYRDQPPPAFSTGRAWYNGYNVLCIGAGDRRGEYRSKLLQFKVEAQFFFYQPEAGWYPFDRGLKYVGKKYHSSDAHRPSPAVIKIN